MADWTWAGKLAADFGILGAFVVAMVMVYRLVDKYAEKFLAASTAQAAAMTDLATAVKDGQSDQREVLMAVRLLADRIERQGRYLELIDQKLEKAA